MKHVKLLVLAVTVSSVCSCAIDHRPEAKDNPFPLHILAINYPGEIEDAISSGVDVDLPDNDGFTALQYAVIYQKEASVRILLAAGADPDAGNKEYSPLSVAAKSPNVEIVRMLLAHRANPNGRHLGRAPLHNAAIFGRAETAGLLVACEATDVNIQEEATGYTPLHCAVLHGKAEVVRVLVRAGVNKEIKDRAGNTPVALANLRTDKTIAALLVEPAETDR